MRRISKTSRLLQLGTALGLIAVTLGGCSGGGTDSDGAGEPMTPDNAVGSWVMQDGTGPEGEFKALEEAPVVLDIEEDGAFSGTSGCNNIFGTMTIEDGTVDMGAVGQTMMFCEEEAMDLEYKYTQALNVVDVGTVGPDSLTLTGPDSHINYKKAD